MASSMQRILVVGVGLIALALAGVQGSKALVAYAKDKRELSDPVANLPKLRERAEPLGLARGPVSETPTPAGDAKPTLEKIRALLQSERELARITNGITDSDYLDTAPRAAELRALVSEAVHAKSYLPSDKLDHMTMFTNQDRTADRVAVRVACVDANKMAQKGDLGGAISRLTEIAGFLGLMADHIDDNGVITWYAGVRQWAATLTTILASPAITEEHLKAANSCIDRGEKCPSLEKICVRMMNELVATTRGIDELPQENIYSLNMNGMNRHDPNKDPKSKQAMEAGVIDYYLRGIEVSKNKAETPLARGLEIDKMLLPLQKEDRIDHYMLRTITPITFQLGQTITRANEINACLRGLSAAASYRLSQKAFPGSLAAKDLSFDIDGHVYSITYVNTDGHPAAYCGKEKPTDYDVNRHVSVDPSQGVYVNL